MDGWQEDAVGTGSPEPDNGGLEERRTGRVNPGFHKDGAVVWLESMDPTYQASINPADSFQQDVLSHFFFTDVQYLIKTLIP